MDVAPGQLLQFPAPKSRLNCGDPIQWQPRQLVRIAKFGNDGAPSGREVKLRHGRVDGIFVLFIRVTCLKDRVDRIGVLGCPLEPLAETCFVDEMYPLRVDGRLQGGKVLANALGVVPTVCEFHQLLTPSEFMVLLFGYGLTSILHTPALPPHALGVHAYLTGSFEQPLLLQDSFPKCSASSALELNLARRLHFRQDFLDELDADGGKLAVQFRQ